MSRLQKSDDFRGLHFNDREIDEVPPMRNAGTSRSECFANVADFVLQPVLPVEDAVIDTAATLLLDTLGVTAASGALAVSSIAKSHALRFMLGNPEEAVPMMFDGRMVSALGAAFVGATQTDNLDAHDGLNETKGHIGCAVVPALYALATFAPRTSGRDMLEAMIVGYEVAARAGMVLHGTVSDYHTSGAWNALGVAAMAIRLLGGNGQQLRHALGIAEYHGPRSQMMREIAHPTMLHDGSGMGAMVGLMAAFQAMDGFQGAPAITVETQDHASIWGNLGKDWSITRNYIKPYPVCRWAHAAIDCMESLRRDHELTPDKVQEITIETFDEGAALFLDPPQTTSQAQYSLAFSVAAMLVYGHVGVSEISGSGLTDETVLEQIPKIVVKIAKRHNDRFPSGRWSSLLVKTSDGQVFSSGDKNARGGPDEPLSSADVKEKFTKFAGTVFPDKHVSALWRMRKKLIGNDIGLRDFSDLVSISAQDLQD